MLNAKMFQVERQNADHAVKHKLFSKQIEDLNAEVQLILLFLFSFPIVLLIPALIFMQTYNTEQIKRRDDMAQKIEGQVYTILERSQKLEKENSKLKEKIVTLEMTGQKIAD